MKRLFLVLFSIAMLTSCSPDADNPVNHHFEYVAVVSVEAPDHFVLGEIHQLKVKYSLPNSCYGYYSYDYTYQNEEREVKTIAIVNDEANCNQTPVEGEYIINVRAEQSEAYTFNFWQADGQYLTMIVPVI